MPACYRDPDEYKRVHSLISQLKLKAQKIGNEEVRKQILDDLNSLEEDLLGWRPDEAVCYSEFHAKLFVIDLLIDWALQWYGGGER